MTEPVEQYNADVCFYIGPIDRDGYDGICKLFDEKKEKKETLCIILITYGGDPDAAYRIARASRHNYKKVEILIPDVCKSAGTLLCIGADKLIVGDRGELGPLDIQLSKPDEMFENMSGLNILQAVNAMQNQVLEAFRTYLVDIRKGSRIRTKTAAEMATTLAQGFIAPIAAKIDPLTLGEHQRAMQIAYEYGSRLSAMVSSMKPNALRRLIAHYPSHGFVIDRKEAAELFNNVAKPCNQTLNYYVVARNLISKLSSHPNSPNVFWLPTEADQNAQLESTDNSHDIPTGIESPDEQRPDQRAKRKSKADS